MGCEVIHLLIILLVIIIVIIIFIILSIIIIVILISTQITNLYVLSHNQLSQSLGLSRWFVISLLSLSDFGRHVSSSVFVSCIVLSLFVLVGFGRRLHGM